MVINRDPQDTRSEQEQGDTHIRSSGRGRGGTLGEHLFANPDVKGLCQGKLKAHSTA